MAYGSPHDASIDRLFELGHHGLVALGGAEVVAGGEGVAGVKTDADAIFFLHQFDNLGELGEVVAQGGALPGHQLQQGSYAGAIGQLGVDAVEGVGDALQSGLFAAAGVGAGMEYDVVDAVGVGALQLIGEGGDAFLPQRIFRGGQVDEIGGVADGVGDAAVRHLVVPAGDILFFHLRTCPLAVAFHKDLDCVAVYVGGRIECVANAAGD